MVHVEHTNVSLVLTTRPRQRTPTRFDAGETVRWIKAEDARDPQSVYVSGAREVNLMFGIVNSDAAVRWAVHFGPATNGRYALCRQGTFSSVSTQVISIPVFGKGMSLAVTNKGQNTQDVDGNVYFIRELP